MVVSVHFIVVTQAWELRAYISDKARMLQVTSILCNTYQANSLKTAFTRWLITQANMTNGPFIYKYTKKLGIFD